MQEERKPAIMGPSPDIDHFEREYFTHIICLSNVEVNFPWSLDLLSCEKPLSEWYFNGEILSTTATIKVMEYCAIWWAVREFFCAEVNGGYISFNYPKCRGYSNKIVDLSLKRKRLIGVHCIIKIFNSWHYWFCHWVEGSLKTYFTKE